MKTDEKGNLIISEASFFYWICKLYSLKLEMGMDKISGKTLDGTEISIYDMGLDRTRIDLIRKD
jgi:hypothetical protein